VGLFNDAVSCHYYIALVIDEWKMRMEHRWHDADN
jgi:hypothetical protein